MTRLEAMETVLSDTRVKSDDLVEWECRRAAYLAGKMRAAAGRPMGKYWVARLQQEFSDGYQSVVRPDLAEF